MLFHKDSDEVNNEGVTTDPIAYNCDNDTQASLVCDPPNCIRGDSAKEAITYN